MSVFPTNGRFDIAAGAEVKIANPTSKKKELRINNFLIFIFRILLGASDSE